MLNKEYLTRIFFKFLGIISVRYTYYAYLTRTLFTRKLLVYVGNEKHRQCCYIFLFFCHS